MIDYIFLLFDQQRRRRRIDRSMIGEPTNFVHTGHMGSGEVQLGNNHLTQLQAQMKSKGGYEQTIPHDYILSAGNVQK